MLNCAAWQSLLTVARLMTSEALRPTATSSHRTQFWLPETSTFTSFLSRERVAPDSILDLIQFLQSPGLASSTHESLQRLLSFHLNWLCWARSCKLEWETSTFASCASYDFVWRYGWAYQNSPVLLGFTILKQPFAVYGHCVLEATLTGNPCLSKVACHQSTFFAWSWWS